MAAQMWEYQVFAGEISRDRLNDLGGQGWELVSVIDGANGPTAYLKRATLPFKERITLEQRAKYARLQGYDLGSGASS